MLSGYLTVKKARILAKAIIDSQFNNAPLIWMFAGKKLINKICKIHHRALQMVYIKYNKLYGELLQLNNKVYIFMKDTCNIFLISHMHLNPELCGLTLMRTLFRMT